MQQETYVLDLIEPLEKLPEECTTSTDPCWKLVNNMTLEVVVPKSMGINPYFETLTRYKIRVQSMRNKTNRLEQLFLEKTNHGTVGTSSK